MSAETAAAESRYWVRDSWPSERHPHGDHPPDELLDVTTPSERIAVPLCRLGVDNEEIPDRVGSGCHARRNEYVAALNDGVIDQGYLVVVGGIVVFAPTARPWPAMTTKAARVVHGPVSDMSRGTRIIEPSNGTNVLFDGLGDAEPIWFFRSRRTTVFGIDARGVLRPTERGVTLYGMYHPVARHVLLASVAASACSSGGSSPGGSGGGGTDGPPPEVIPFPDEDGTECAPVGAASDVFGWVTSCEVESSSLLIEDHETLEFMEVPRDPAAPASGVCCEGSPSIAVADQGCQDACVRARCAEAQLIHEELVATTGCYLQPNGCSFPFDECLSGHASVSYLTAISGGAIPPIEYEVFVQCVALSAEPRNPDGSFGFIEKPDNFPFNDPAICGKPAGLTPEDPGALGSLASYRGVDDSGMQARISWGFGGVPGADSTDTVDASLEYSVRPCNNVESCISLASLNASVGDLNAGGLTVQAARFSVTGVDDEPVIRRGGVFTYPAGSIHAVLSAKAVGDESIAIYASNVAPASGKHDPTNGILQLSNLQFSYDDPCLTGTLTVDISASYANRPPSAAIRPLYIPPLCSTPTVFQAASSEPDGDAMTHEWWAPGIATGSGATFEISLPFGQHPIVLVTSDTFGNQDVEVIVHRSMCQ